jgi:hypothetical protein
VRGIEMEDSRCAEPVRVTRLKVKVAIEAGGRSRRWPAYREIVSNGHEHLRQQADAETDELYFPKEPRTPSSIQSPP